MHEDTPIPSALLSLSDVAMHPLHPGKLDLKALLQMPELQALLEDFHRLTQAAVSILDLDGKVLVSVGRQEICRRFHLADSRTARRCVESDLLLTRGIKQGEYRTYKCHNGLWNVATPLWVAGIHAGNIYAGQFFREDELVDLEAFSEQAGRYGFDEGAYLAAVKRVPRLGQDQVRARTDFLARLTEFISEMSLRKLQAIATAQAQARITEALRISEERYRAFFEFGPDGVVVLDPGTARPVEFNDQACRQLGYTREEFSRLTIPDIQTEDPAAEVFGRLRRIMQEGHDDFETLHRTKDGELRNIHVTARSVRIGKVGMCHEVLRDITEQKRAEKALCESKLELARLIGNLPGFVYRSTRGGGGWSLGYLSEGFRAITGHDPEDFTGIPGLSHHSLIPADHLGPVKNKWQQALGERSLFEAEYPIMTAGGEIRWGWERGRGVYDEEDHLLHIEGFVTDITEQKKAKEALREAHRFSKSIINHVEEGIVVHGLDLRCRIWNPFMEHFSGLSASEALGKHPLEFLPGCQETGFMDGLHRSLAGESFGPVDLPFRVPGTGELKWITYFTTPLRSTKGEISGVIATISDITGRKIQELELQRMNRLYRLLSQLGQCLVRVGTREDLLRRFCSIAVETGGFPLVWVAWRDPVSGRAVPLAQAGEAVAYLDEAAQWGRLHPEALGTPDICFREDRSVVCQDIAQAAYMDAWRPMTESHGLRAAAAFPIRLQGRIAGAFMIYAQDPDAFREQEVALLEKAASDISFGLDHFASEDEKAALQSQLHQAQKMESLGLLAGGIAHDMNNVLGAILILASSSLEAQPEGSPAARTFGTIIKATERGARMLQGLLSFARQTPAEERELDMNAIFREEVRLLERTTFARIHLRMDLAPDLKPIRGDASALTNALMNLCLNAVDAMQESGTLTLRTRNHEPGWIEIQVEDTGCGMPREVLEKALDPFFTTKPEGKGTGLGLSMAYNTMKAHRGTMEIQSRPGSGTLVKMRLPACEAATPAQEAVPGPAAPGASRSLRVLLVDDDELIQSSLQCLLKHLGHTITPALSGEEALGQLEAGLQPDVVILDINMPGLGGAGTLPRLRKLQPIVPVLLATGRADQVALDLVEADEHATLLPKPFSMNQLRERLDFVTRNRVVERRSVDGTEV